jgi:prepilin-type processing-associated H-X9-DG protein
MVDYARDASGNTDFKIPKIGSVKRAGEVALLFDGSLRNPDPNSPLCYAGQSARRLDRGRIISNDSNNAYLCADLFPPSGGASWNTPDSSIDLTIPTGGGRWNSSTAVDYANINKDNDVNRSNIRFRHNGDRDCNVLFLDGHVDVHSWTGGSLPVTNGARGYTGVSLMRGSVFVNLTN